MNADAGTPWATPGGDYGPDFITTSAAGPGGVERFDVTDFVNDMIAGTRENNGFLITPATSENLAIQMQDHIYYSSEYEDVSKRPALILDDGIIPVIQPLKFSQKDISITCAGESLVISSEREKVLTVSLFQPNGQLLQRNISDNGKVLFQKEPLCNQIILITVENGALSYSAILHIP